MNTFTRSEKLSWIALAVFLFICVKYGMQKDLPVSSKVQKRSGKPIHGERLTVFYDKEGNVFDSGGRKLNGIKFKVYK